MAKETVLIIEDDPDIVELLQYNLEREGYRVLTAEDGDIVTGLELGADDYVTKPFSPREVISRIRAVLRRGATGAGDNKTRLEIGGVALDSERHEVTVAGEPVAFTRTEFSLLWTLMKKPGRVS